MYDMHGFMTERGMFTILMAIVMHLAIVLIARPFVSPHINAAARVRVMYAACLSAFLWPVLWVLGSGIADKVLVAAIIVGYAALSAVMGAKTTENWMAVREMQRAKQRDGVAKAEDRCGRE